MFTVPLKTMNNFKIVVGQTVESCSLHISQHEDVHPILKVLGCLNGSVGSLLPNVRVSVMMSRSPYFEGIILSLELCPEIKEKLFLKSKLQPDFSNIS